MDWGCRACGGSNPAGTRFCGHCGTAADEPEATDERRLITALFADISGFTTLADRLDAEELHAVISPVIGVLAGIAERYGGTLAKYAGDAVLVFFGAPVAQEDHASRALLCAQSMHAELAEALPRLPAEAQGLELHIGVNSGTVIAGMFGGDIRTDYSILGDAVNVAQRLESVAPPGETYAGELTHQLTAEEFEFEDLGELTLKGKTKGVPGWRFLGRRTENAVPATANALVGRRRELEALVDVLDTLATGGGRVLSVTAEAGAGKSRLTQEMQRIARDRDLVWLDARAVSYGISLPYWPLVDLLRRSFGIRIEQDPHQSSQALAAALSVDGVPEVASYFARVLGLPQPESSADVPADPEVFQHELHDAVTTWLRQLASVRPVVLSVEDMHWVDASSVDLLVHLAETVVADSPVLLYLTTRPDGAPATERVAAAVPASNDSLALSPLDEDAFDELLTQVLGRRAAPALRSVVFERAAGNPFFGQELARTLLADGALVTVDDRWDLPVGWDPSAIPPTIEGVLTARMDRLPRTAVTVLQAASVIGRTVNVPLLEGTVEDVADVVHALDQLVAAGFLDRAVGDGRETLLFHHALMVDVAYARLVRRQRRDLHRRVAETAEVLYGTGDDVIDLLARHFYLAEGGVKAVDYLQQAARRSARLFANDEAIVHLTRAVELTRATERLTSRLPTLLLELAELEDLTGRYDDAAPRYHEARDLTGEVRAWRGMAAVRRKRGDFAGTLELVDEAFAVPALKDHDLTVLWLERTWALINEGNFRDAIDAARSGLAATSEPEGRDAGQLLLQLARAETAVGMCLEALEHGERAEIILERAGDLRGRGTTLRVIGNVYADLDDTEQAAGFFRRALDVAERTGDIEERAGCLVNLGMMALRQGRLDEAIAADREALAALERIGHTTGVTMVSANLAEKLAQAGDVDDAVELCDRALALANESGDTWTVADCHRTLAQIRLLQDLPDEAVAQADLAARLFGELDDAASVAQCETLASEAMAATATRGGGRDRP